MTMRAKQNNLILATMAKGCTVQDIKSEAVLVAVYDLLDNFVKFEESGNTKPLLSDTHHEDMDYIKDLSKELLEYLKEKILTADRLDRILLDADKSSQHYIKARIIEPIAYFYEKIQKLISSYTKTICIEETTGKVFYMPELLAFKLIRHLKENEGYNFKRFEKIENLDLSKVDKIYWEFSKEINNATGKKVFLEDLKDKNLISKMNYISLNTIKTLINYKYVDRTKPQQIKRNSKRKKRKK